MRNVQVERSMRAPRSQVWAVLADYPNIADWNEGVTKSYSTSEATEGVGAKRHCDLAPLGGLEETIAEWEPEERMVVSIDSASRIPVKRGLVTFTLVETGDEMTGTTVTLRYEYVPKGGPLGALIGPLLDGQLRKGFTGFLEQLETAAADRAVS